MFSARDQRLLPLRPALLHHLRHAATRSVSHATAHLRDSSHNAPAAPAPSNMDASVSAASFLFHQTTQSSPPVAAPRWPQNQRAAAPDRKWPQDVFLLSAAVAPPINI